MNKLNDGSDFLERIDAVCAGFAQALRSTSNDMTAVSIESLLSRHSDLPRQELLRELLREELEYLQNRGQHPSADDLQRRFPHDSDIIAEVLSSAQVGAGVPGNDRTLPADPGHLADSGPQAANTHGSRDEWKPQIEGFQLFEQLGKGGMGVVYRAIDHHRRQVALKVLPHDRLTDKRAQERFNNEIYALGRLRHQNIVQVHESGHRNGEYFYSMDYIRGQNLAALIRAASDQIGVRKAGASAVTPPIAGLSTHQTQPSGSGPKVDTGSGSNPPLPEGAIVYPSSDFLQSFIGRRPAAENRRATAAVVQIGIDVAEALHYAHESGVTHRDLKPANLLLDVTGRVWVADFGLAQVDDGAALTMEGEVLGTWRYMSPEQLMGGRVIVDSLTDIYSLGVTLYELLSLQPARDGKDRGEVRNQVAFGDAVPLRQRNPAVPRDLETIIHRAMAYRPKDRYQTMQELAADLRRFQRREPILAKPAGPLKRFSLWVEREQKLAASLAASAALLLIILGLLLAFVNTERVHQQLRATQESNEKKTLNELLKDSEAARLTTASLLLCSRHQQPSLALLLAAESFKIRPTADATEAAILALRTTHEIRSWQIRNTGNLEETMVIHPSATSVITTVGPDAFRTAKKYTAIESDIQTGKLIRSYGGEGIVFKATWDQTGTYLATLEAVPTPSPNPDSPATCQITASVWDKATGTLQFTRPIVANAPMTTLSTAPSWPLAFASPTTGSNSVVVGGVKTLSMYRVPEGQEIQLPQNLSPSRPYVASAARFVSATDNPGTRLAYLTDDGTITVADPTHGQILWQDKLNKTTAITSNPAIDMLQNGTLLALSGRLLTVYDAFGHFITRRPCTTFSVSANGNYAIIANAQSPLMVMNTDHILSPTLHSQPDLQSLTISPDAAFCFTSSWGSKHRLHHLTPHSKQASTIAEIHALAPPTTASQFLDATRLLLLSADGTLSLLSVHPISESHTLTHNLHNAKRGPFTVTRDSRLIAYRDALSPRTLVVPMDGQQPRILTGKLRSITPTSTATPVTDDGRQFRIHQISDRSDSPPASLLLPSEATTLLLLTPSQHQLYRTSKNEIVDYDLSTELANVVVPESANVTLTVAHLPTNTVAFATNNGNSLALYRDGTTTVLTLPDDSQILEMVINQSGSSLLALCSNSRVFSWPITASSNPIKPTYNAALPLQYQHLSVHPEGEQFLAWISQQDKSQLLRGSTKSATTTTADINSALNAVAWQSSNNILLGTSAGLFQWNADSTPTATNIVNPILSVFSTHAGVAIIETPTQNSHPRGLTVPSQPNDKQAQISVALLSHDKLQRQSSTVIPGLATSALMMSDKTALAVGFEGYETRIMAFAQQRPFLLPEFSSGKILLQQFLPDNRTLLTVTSSGALHLYDFDLKRQEHFQLSLTTLDHAMLSDNGHVLTAFTTTNEVIFFSISERRESGIMSMPDPYSQDHYYSFANSNTISVHSSDGSMTLWVRGGDTLRKVEVASPITCLLRLNEQHMLAVKKTEDSKSEAILINSNTGEETELPLQFSGEVVSMHPNPTASHVLFRYAEGHCELWNRIDDSFESAGSLGIDLSAAWHIHINENPLMIVSLDSESLSVFDVGAKSLTLSVPCRQSQHRSFVGYTSRSDYQSPLMTPDGKWVFLPEQVLEYWPQPLNSVIEGHLPRSLTTEEVRYFRIRHR